MILMSTSWNGKRLREFRRSKGWSQAELARRIGVKAITILRMEKEESKELSRRVALAIQALANQDTSPPIRSGGQVAFTDAVPAQSMKAIEQTLQSTLASEEGRRYIEETLKSIESSVLDENAKLALVHKSADPEAREQVESKFEEYLRKFLKILPRIVSESALALYFYMKTSSDSFLEKSIAIGALVYFITPIDAIPDTLPMIGFIDDASVIAAAVAYYGVKLDLHREEARKWLDQEDAQ